MSKFEHKEESGSLFRNEKKESEKHPDYKGSALIYGTEFWISAWINEASNGTKYMSLKFQKKEEVHEAKPIAAPSDDLPF